MKAYFTVGTIFIGILVLLFTYTDDGNIGEELERDTKKDKSSLVRMWAGGITTTITVITFFVTITYLIRTYLIKRTKDFLFTIFIFIILPIILGYIKEKRWEIIKRKEIPIIANGKIYDLGKAQLIFKLDCLDEFYLSEKGNYFFVRRKKPDETGKRPLNKENIHQIIDLEEADIINVLIANNEIEILKTYFPEVLQKIEEI